MEKFLKKNKILAIIPARSGSIGIKNKNLSKIGGSNLLKQAINVCKKVKLISRIIVSTDSRKIADVARKEKLEVPFYRSKKNSKSNSKILDALKETIYKTEFYYNEKYEYIILIEPTSPLRRPTDIKKAINKFLKKKYNSLWTLSKVSLDFHPLKQLFLKNDNLYYFDKSSSKIFNRQELNETFVRNGVCYIFKKDKILKSNTILLQNTGYLILNEKHISIDTVNDLIEANKLFRQRLFK